MRNDRQKQQGFPYVLDFCGSMKRLYRVLPALLGLSLLAPTGISAQGMGPLRGMSTRARDSLILSTAKLPDRNCYFSTKITNAPAATLIDLQSLSTAVSGIVVAPKKYAVFSVRIDRTGIVTSRVLESTVDRKAADAINAAIPSVVRLKPDSVTAYFRVRVERVSDDVRVRTGSSVTCMPVPENEAEMTRAAGSLAKEFAKTRKLVESREVGVFIYLEENGRFTKGRIVGSSGDSEIDTAVLDLFLKRARFSPGTVDGQIFPAWIKTGAVLRFQQDPLEMSWTE